MKWLAASCALCAGCDLLFAIHGVESPAPEAGVGPIDAASSVACSSIAMLADDFDDGDFDVLWGASVDPGDALVERDGTAQLQLATPDSSVTLFSKAYYAMSEGSLTLDVQAPGFAAGERSRAPDPRDRPDRGDRALRQLQRHTAVIRGAIADPA
jgi:hypothetical protein